MKRTKLLALAAAMCFGATAFAQSNQEVTYVEDPSQGYLFNRFKDNWFITAQGGANVMFSHGDSERDLQDRFSPAADIYVGKWFSPLLGFRGGISWESIKGMSDRKDAPGVLLDKAPINGKYKQRFHNIGPAFDVMLNLTNWWCGYHPGRKYNAIIYGGIGAYWTYAANYHEKGNSYERHGYKSLSDRILAGRLGLINSFSISNRVDLFLDVRWTPQDNNHHDEYGGIYNRTSHNISAFLGVTVNLGKNYWNAPVVPVCPEPENCDALRALLGAAEARIADLENQLQDCLNRPVPEAVVEHAPLATIYYPINVYRLTQKDKVLLKGISDVMKANPDKTYTLTGWADNYTGNDQINTRLRKNRAAGVEKQLIKYGVPASQLTTTIDNGNLCPMGEKYVALDRATTINENN